MKVVEDDGFRWGENIRTGTRFTHKRRIQPGVLPAVRLARGLSRGWGVLRGCSEGAGGMGESAGSLCAGSLRLEV